MNLIARLACFLFVFLSFFLHPLHPAFANQEGRKLPTITVINPIRGPQLGLDKGDLLDGLSGQWNAVKKYNIPATWLWQYSALENTKLTNFAKENMKNQEFGVFLEVDRNFADKSSVLYRGRGPWYFSDGLFLFSYDESEREKLIDALFNQFKKTFGYYPKTVGAWWISADSLQYMHEKYGVVAALHAADQFDLDVYTIWGTPWSIPYLPSKENAGIPASSWDSSQKLVMMQWAARDPLRGYGNTSEASTYSIQDYSLKNYDSSYVDYILSIYLQRPLDQIVVGLENNISGSLYEGGYTNLMKKISLLRDSQKVVLATAQNYANNFLAQKTVFPPTNYFLTKDYENDNQSFWYNAPNYRIGIQKKDNVISLVDVRDYSQKTSEEYSVLPNSQGFLHVQVPAVIDSAHMPWQQKIIAKNTNPLSITKEAGKIILYAGGVKIGTFDNTKATIYSNDIATTYPTTAVSTDNYNYVFILIVIAVIAYFLFMYASTKNIKKTLFDFSFYLIIFLLAYPFLSYYLGQGVYVFDRKELILAPLLAVPFFSFPVRFTIVFAILPFVLLLVAHFFFIIRLSKKALIGLYYLLLSGVMFMYLHFPYFPIDRSTYPLVGKYSVGVLLIFALGGVVLYVKKKSKKLLLFYGGSVLE